MNDFVTALNGSSLFTDSILKSGVLDDWTNLAVRVADVAENNTTQDRIAAMAFLAEVWVVRGSKQEDINDLA